MSNVVYTWCVLTISLTLLTITSQLSMLTLISLANLFLMNLSHTWHLCVPLCSISAQHALCFYMEIPVVEVSN